MFRRFSNSWELVKASWGVLLADKELLIFPFLSSIAAIIVTVTFFVPSILAGFFEGATGISILGYVITFLFYTVLYTVTFFFNSALVGAAMIRLNGGDPTVSDGMRIAFKHMGAILGYAVIAATVGMILRAISERSGMLGRIVVGLVGMAWNLATFLVVPVLVMEEVGPIEAIKRSTSLLKRTWGEQIGGNLSIGFVFFLINLLVLFGAGALIFLFSSIGSSALIIGIIVLAVGVIILLSLISSALNAIYTAALYKYATDGSGGGFFDSALIEQAFQRK